MANNTIYHEKNITRAYYGSDSTHIVDLDRIYYGAGKGKSNILVFQKSLLSVSNIGDIMNIHIIGTGNRNKDKNDNTYPFKLIYKSKDNITHGTTVKLLCTKNLNESSSNVANEMTLSADYEWKTIDLKDINNNLYNEKMSMPSFTEDDTYTYGSGNLSLGFEYFSSASFSASPQENAQGIYYNGGYYIDKFGYVTKVQDWGKVSDHPENNGYTALLTFTLK